VSVQDQRKLLPGLVQWLTCLETVILHVKCSEGYKFCIHSGMH